MFGINHSEEKMTDFYFNPRSGEEIINATPGSDFRMYIDLCKERKSAAEIMLGLPKKCFVLLSSPERLTKGHWLGVLRDDRNKKIYYFDSYGYKPDAGKNKWLTRRQREETGQIRNVFNDGLKELCRRGWEVHYNDVRYQVEGDSSATCGIWASAFLNSGENPDEFKEDHSRVEDYFKQFFLKE